MKILNNNGFAHFLALALVVVGVATFGTYTLVRSNAQVPPSSCTLQVLRNGSKGTCVKLLQQKVGASPDSIFGPATEAAVKQYQSANGLTADGVVGKATWSKLLKTAVSAPIKRPIASAPQSTSTTQIYCTYRDSADRTLVKNAPMTRTQCKALRGSPATTVKLACTYLDLGKNFKSKQVNTQAECDTKKKNNAGGICTYPTNKTVAPKLMTRAYCEKPSISGPSIWTAF